MDDGARTRTGAVMGAIRGKLVTRALLPGDRLPSIRRLATTMRVSPSTVVEAYERLAAEGLIRARPGSGFYVSGQAPALALAGPEPRRDRAVDPLWMQRQSLDADARLLKPGCGWLPADWMPTAALRRAVRDLARAEAAVLTDYAGTKRGGLASPHAGARVRSRGDRPRSPRPSRSRRGASVLLKGREIARAPVRTFAPLILYLEASRRKHPRRSPRALFERPARVVVRSVSFG